MIDRGIASDFIEAVEQFSSYKIRMYDEGGGLICGNDPHALSASRRAFSSVETVSTIEGKTEDGLETAIFSPILVDEEPVGCINLVGGGSDMHAVLAALRMSLETRLKYETAERTQRKILGRNEKLIRMLLCDPKADAEKRARIITDGGYAGRIPRVPILLLPKSESFMDAFASMSFNYDSSQDIIATLDDRVAILKDMSHAHENYRTYCLDYLSFLRESVSFDGILLTTGWPTPLALYNQAYAQLEWMRTHTQLLPEKASVLCFCDCLDEFFLSLVPKDSFQSVFQGVINNLTFEPDEYLQITGALMENNYNLVKASKSLFMHKNTLVYKLEKLKRCLRIDPINNSHDRVFVRYLHHYLKLLNQTPEQPQHHSRTEHS